MTHPIPTVLLKYLNAFIFYCPLPYVCLLFSLFILSNLIFFSHAQGHFLTNCRSNTGQHSALTEGGANTLHVSDLNLTSFSVQVPQPEVTDLKMTRKPFKVSGC